MIPVKGRVYESRVFVRNPGTPKPLNLHISILHFMFNVPSMWLLVTLDLES